ncbi:MAG TPA: NHLP leader peptide family RiPP precursor [Reyranella sp.]|nr:NHLP leader peptide family RiPP precursor [Reyranella sp.]
MRRTILKAGAIAAISAEDHAMGDADQHKPALNGKVIARAWREPAFKAKLIADPRATLTAAGVSVPGGVTVKVVEDTDTHLHFVLPPKPTGQLSDEALDKVAAGSLTIGSGKYTKIGMSEKGQS